MSLTFSSPGEIQQFLSWCRSNGILRIKVGDVEAHMLPPDSPQVDSAVAEVSKLFSDEPVKDDKLPASSVDRELLMWSAR